MRRKVFATLLILHGLAHAAPGMWAAGDGPPWVVTPLWGAALLGYVAAGLGLFRMPVFRRWWTQSLIVASASSIVLLTVFAERVGVIGALLDVALLIVAFRLCRSSGGTGDRRCRGRRRLGAAASHSS